MARFHHSFVPWGFPLEPREGVVAVDVGNKAVPGVIDHHQADVAYGCAASLIVRDPELLKGAPECQAEQDWLERDAQRYRRDIERVDAEQITVLSADRTQYETVDCAYIEDPESALFKYLIRLHTIASPGGQGFRALHVVYTNQLEQGFRHVLSFRERLWAAYDPETHLWRSPAPHPRSTPHAPLGFDDDDPDTTWERVPEGSEEN